MNTERDQHTEKGRNIYNHFRTSLDLGMGVLYIVIGGMIISLKYFGNVFLGSNLAYALGGLIIAYGLFRIYRGAISLRNKRRDINKEFPDLYKHDSKN